VMLLLKFASLAALRPGQAALAIVCAHVVSRAAPLLLMVTLPYAKPQAQSKAKPVAQGVGWKEIVIGALSAALAVGATGALAWSVEGTPQTYAAPWTVALSVSFAAALASAAPLGAWFRARLGGYTGDCLGAAQQVSEVVFYLCFSAALGTR